MICYECMRGFLCGECTIPTTTTEEASDNDNVTNRSTGNLGSKQVVPHFKRAYPLKRDAALKDQQSTGRKRAARFYPLDRDKACEWQAKANCGGGSNPIQGCYDGMQLNRHHGPDKNTLNNDEGNVHRICAHCHNRWHAANDPDYIPGQPLKD